MRAADPDSRLRGLRASRVVAFAALFILLQLSWQELSDTVVHRWVVNDAAVGVTVSIINAVTPAVHAEGRGTAVHAVGGGLNIINGCDGTETWLLLCAAFAVAPLGLGRRLAGLLVGTVAAFGINELRLLALFYANRANPGLFNLLHAVVGPIAVILLVAAFFHFWMMRHAPRAAAHV